MSTLIKAPLKLYWWNAQPNFGDALSPLIIEHISGREVEWASPEKCELFSLGSIMHVVRRSHHSSNRDIKPWIWGTGNMFPHRMDFLENVNFAAVRGPLTAGIVGNDDLVKGDPGILTGELYQNNVSQNKEYKLGIVLHLSREPSAEMIHYTENNKHCRFIDVKNTDAMEVISEIAKCEFIVATSLHALVVADSLGIPNVWLNPAGNHKRPRFKFYDYANSIERPLKNPSSFAEFVESGALNDGVDCAYFKNIPAVAERLEKSFPSELRANG